MYSGRQLPSSDKSQMSSNLLCIVISYCSAGVIQLLEAEKMDPSEIAHTMITSMFTVPVMFIKNFEKNTEKYLWLYFL